MWMVASRDRIKFSDPQIHLASHFQFEPGDETQSFLLLGDGKHLSLAKVRDQPHVFDGVDLLALSACDAAVAGGAGSEVDGLARIAQDQGAAATDACSGSGSGSSRR